MNVIYTITLTDIIFEDRIKKINKLIPGPPTIPVFGNLLQINSKDFPKSVNSFYERYGHVFRLRLGNVEAVVLTGGEILDECFNKQHREIFKERYLKFSRFFGKNLNIIFSNGDYHYILRGILSSEITTRKLNNQRIQSNKFIIDMLNNVCGDNSETLVKDTPTQMRILAVKLVLNFTLGIEENEETILKIVDKVRNVFRAAGLLMYSDYLPFLFPLDIKSMAKNDIVSSYAFLNGYIEKKLDAVKIKINKELNKETTTTTTATTTDSKTTTTTTTTNYNPIIEDYYKKYLDGSIHYDSILLSVVDIILAAVDTTANNIGFLIARLINNPEIQDKIYEEIMRNDKDINLNTISLADNTKFPYIVSVMNELYRYYALVSITEPNKTTEDVIVNGYKIAKGTMVIKNLRGTHLSKEFWGDDALEFKPERFKTQHLNQKGVFSFGAGPRGCPGGKFTESFTFTFLVILIKNYKLQNPNHYPIDDEGEIGLAKQCKSFGALFDIIFEDRIKKINKLIPGPPTVPIFGNLLQINSKDFPKSVNDFYERYGKVFRLRLGNVEVVVLTGGEILDECFNKKHREIFKERYLKFSRFFGKNLNIIFSNGDYHYILRGILTSEITSRKLINGRIPSNKFIIDMLKNVCKDKNETLVKDTPTQIRILVVKMVLYFTLGIEENEEIVLKIVEKIRIVFEAAGLLMYSDYLPFLFLLDIKSMAKSDIISNYTFLKKFIEKKLENVKNNFKKNELDEGMSKSKNNPIIEDYYKKFLDGSIHYESIISSIVDIILAAVDSSSNGSSFLIARLINDQEIQDKIYDEILRNEKDNNSIEISFADHSKYPYTISVINESYRYYTLVPITEPNKTTEDVIINGYKIAKGTMIIKNLRGTHLSKEFWGDNALEFKPERFKTNTLNQKDLFHFGAGPRGCPGGRLTEFFSFTILTTLVKNYRLLNPNDYPINDKGEVGLAMQCKSYDALFVKRN
ncbi:hypothetical protein ACTA71_000262 [Dictyostelium dimigraforme]